MHTSLLMHACMIWPVVAWGPQMVNPIHGIIKTLVNVAYTVCFVNIRGEAATSMTIAELHQPP